MAAAASRRAVPVDESHQVDEVTGRTGHQQAPILLTAGRQTGACVQQPIVCTQSVRHTAVWWGEGGISHVIFVDWLAELRFNVLLGTKLVISDFLGLTATCLVLEKRNLVAIFANRKLL